MMHATCWLAVAGSKLANLKMLLCCTVLYLLWEGAPSSLPPHDSVCLLFVMVGRVFLIRAAVSKRNYPLATCGSP